MDWDDIMFGLIILGIVVLLFLALIGAGYLVGWAVDLILQRDWGFTERLIVGLAIVLVVAMLQPPIARRD
jgi:membrane protein implicated in regulation of membrane protease activity